MNDILQEKYNRLMHEYPNIPGIDKPLMNISDVLGAYFILRDMCDSVFRVVKNHCFIDGNKRTALLTLLYQLELYGYMPNAKVREFETLTMSVAADTPGKEFISAMNKLPGCKCYVDSMKIKLEYAETRKLLGILPIRSNAKRYSIPFRGDTRTIGAKTIRAARINNLLECIMAMQIN